MLALLARFLRRHGGVLVTASLAWLVVGASHGCVPGEDACRRSRTCLPGTGAVSIVEHWQGDPAGGGTGGAGGTAGEGGMGGQGGRSGEGGTGPAHEVPPTEEGDECSPNGLYACAGHATRKQLVCERGFFVAYGTCPADERCDTRPETLGLCQPAVPECLEHLPGDIVCSGAKRLICGADLVTAQELDVCPNACVDGVCTECFPDTQATCEFNSVRSCTAAGAWKVEPCDSATPHCSNDECGTPTSCVELEATCGIDEDEACCASPVVTGGPINNPNPMTISSYRLDRFEVTVGRFRAFRTAWDLGWRPEVGSGKHAHLNDGMGLATDTAIPFERGWRSTYLSYTDPSDGNLLPPGNPNDARFATWSPAPSGEERRPINFINVFEAYAFCIWDGGFLPTIGERLRAARAGDELRPYPWGLDPPEANFALAIYDCHFPESGTCTGREKIAPVGTARGEGPFGQLDLAGNVAEWTLGPPGPGACVECVSELILDGNHPVRGGAFNDDAAAIASGATATMISSARYADVGFRCARSP